MGNSYRAVCDNLQQQIDPGRLGPNCGDKDTAITHPKHPFGVILTYAMTSGMFWGKEQVRMIHDNDECDEVAFDEYEDITDEVFKEYTEWSYAFYDTWAIPKE